MFFYRFCYLPDAFQAGGEYDKVPRPERYGFTAVGPIGNGYGPFKKQTGFSLGIVPVEGAFLACPDRPVFALGGLGFTWFADNNIFYGWHFDHQIMKYHANNNNYTPRPQADGHCGRRCEMIIHCKDEFDQWAAFGNKDGQ